MPIARNILRDWLIAASAAAVFVNVGQAQQVQHAARGPLARLVRTPDDSGMLPPYALTDQAGTIQRYVEPTPGLDLEPYVNQIVSVRHDTGQNLLASQLELPAQSLMPMIGDPAAAHPYGVAGAGGAASNASYGRVQQAQHIDTDDATVELLEEGEPLADSVVVPQGAFPPGAVYPDGSYPAFPGPMSPGMAPMGGGSVYCDPMYCGPAIGPYPQGPAPLYGGYPGADAAGMGFLQPFANGQTDRPHVYADLELNFLRAHVAENGFGKLSEKYDFSPRFIIGFTDLGGLNGRVRYWIYGRETQVLSDGGVRLEFDVLDLETTHHFAGRRSVVALGAGLRLANIELEDENGQPFGSDLIGLTLAADGHTPFLTFDRCTVGFVYGGRLSLLGGDWGGDDAGDFFNGESRDDNVVVHELYTGLEFAQRFRACNLHARLAFEMQNWHSDVLAQDLDVESIAILGPGLQIGAEF